MPELAVMTGVRVMTYNIHGGRRRRELARVVRSVAPDVLVANESPKLPLLWRWQCERLSRDWAMRYIAGGRSAGSNLLVGSSRVQVLHSRACRDPQPLFQPRRGIVTAQLQLGTILYGLVGCHLSLRPDTRHREVELVIEAAATLSGPVVVAGDLNEVPGGHCWTRLKAAGFTDAGATSGPTFPATSPDRRIDAVLVRGAGVRDQPAAALHPQLLAVASDHRPVAALLELDLSARRGSPKPARRPAARRTARRR